jgi:HPt (histidine-containing phosphotransfer) domain-containing protein
MPIIDTTVFRTLQDDVGAEFVSELVGTFLEEVPGMLRELRSAWDDSSAERFRRAAHSLKSNASTFGAVQFEAQARELELSSMPPDDAPIVALQNSLTAAAMALQELCRD